MKILCFSEHVPYYFLKNYNQTEHKNRSNTLKKMSKVEGSKRQKKDVKTEGAKNK